MRATIAILFLLHACLVWGQVPEMTVTDLTFRQAIDIFLDSVERKKLPRPSVILAVVSKLEEITPTQQWLQDTTKGLPRESRWSYDLLLNGSYTPGISNDWIPSHKFKYRGRDVYLFFGAKHFLEYKEGDLKKVEKRENRKYQTMAADMGLLCHIQDKEIQVTWGYFVDRR